jgi:hypothetical protein
MRTLLLLSMTLLSLAACGSVNRCSDQTFGGNFCIPDAGVAPAGQALTLDIIDACHAGCGTANFSCVVSRDGGTIALSLEGQVCDPAPGVQCALLCALTHHTCQVPALPEGDYVVTSPSQPSQTLQVRDAGVGSCSAVPF